MKRDFRRIDPRHARIVLLDAGERVVAAFTAHLQRAARSWPNWPAGARAGPGHRDRLPRRDPEIGGQTERIATRTVVWAAGVRTAGIAEIVARAAGADTDRAGHVQVNPDLSLPGPPGDLGDRRCASLAGPDGKPLPGLATVAIQQARHVAKAIHRGPGASTPFRYFDKGSLAVVGRGKAVCEVRGTGSGPLAFLMYLGVSPFYLGGVGGRRLNVGLTDRFAGSERGESAGRAWRAATATPGAGGGPADDGADAAREG